MRDTMYFPRVVDSELNELLLHVPAVLIDGAKGVGKTATAEQRVSTVIRLYDPAERAVIAAAPPKPLSGPDQFFSTSGSDCP